MGASLVLLPLRWEFSLPHAWSWLSSNFHLASPARWLELPGAPGPRPCTLHNFLTVYLSDIQTACAKQLDPVERSPNSTPNTHPLSLSLISG